MLKKILIVWISFVVFAVVGGGGERFRLLNDEAGWVTQKIVDLLAAKADSLKGEVDSLKERIKEWTGDKKDLAKNIP
ncbi:MAG: hypothetical protein ACOYW7_14450 [Nitrospirota bacterium]